MPATQRGDEPIDQRDGTDHEVIIAGGGPTGMMLAAELQLSGVDVVIVERRRSQDLDGSRAGGLLARTIEVLDQRGVAERFVDAGTTYPMHGFAHITFDVADLPTRHNYTLGLWQADFERIMADWIVELGVTTLRGCEVASFAQDHEGVDVEIAGDAPQTLRAHFLVGCDGGRSVVRKAAGIAFEGHDPSISWMIAEVVMDEEPELGYRRDSTGTHAIGRRLEHEPIRLVLTEAGIDRSEPTFDDLKSALNAIYGTDFGLRSANWISRFTDMSRQAVEYRKGRVLLAGDSAHIHAPMGGQGLNTGVQDAVNLGWKLAQVLRGTSPIDLLDTYHAERHPVGARVVHNTMAQVALSGPDDRHQALRDTMSQLLAMEEPRKHIAAMLLGLDIHYQFADDDRVTHPLVGRRMPDVDIEVLAGRDATKAHRLYELLHDVQPVLVNFGDPGTVDISGWSDRVKLVDATTKADWELPVIGPVDPPGAVLVRPDGYVAWAGDASDPGRIEALTLWFGLPTPAETSTEPASAPPSAG